MSGHESQRAPSAHILAVLAGAAGLFVGYIAGEVIGLDLAGGEEAAAPVSLAEASRAELCGALASRVEEAEALNSLAACVDLFAPDPE